MARNKNQILLLVSQHTKSPTFFKQDMFYFYENGVSHHFSRGDHFVLEVRLKKKKKSVTFWNCIGEGSNVWMFKIEKKEAALKRILALMK